jgi:hypothetical protein
MAGKKEGKQMKSRIGFMAAIAAAVSVGAGFARIPVKAYEDYRRQHGGKKSSGGRGTVRINSPEYTGWKKLFSGLAVPKFYDLSGAASHRHISSERGPRPETFYKRQRAKLA